MYGNETGSDRTERAQMASMSVPLRAAEPVRSQDVAASAQELERSISRLADAVDSLIARLHPVLAADSTNATTEPVPTRGACMVSGAIWEAGARIDAQMRRVNDAIQRLEV